MPKSPKFESFPLSKSRFLISPPYQTIRVTNCSRMQISDLFSLEDLHNRRPQQIIPSMGGVLRAKFENRTWSVRNAELLVYASFSVKTVDVTGKNHTWLHRFNNKKHIYFYNFGWIHLKHTRIAVAFFRWNFFIRLYSYAANEPALYFEHEKAKERSFLHPLTVLKVDIWNVSMCST